jgi:hypothetical protein
MYITNIFSCVYSLCLVNTQSQHEWITDTSENHSHENETASSAHGCDVYCQLSHRNTLSVNRLDYTSPSHAVLYSALFNRSSTAIHSHPDTAPLFIAIYGDRSTSGMAANRNIVSRGISGQTLCGLSVGGCTENDLKSMGVKRWREKAKDRSVFAIILQNALVKLCRWWWW